MQFFDLHCNLFVDQIRELRNKIFLRIYWTKSKSIISSIFDMTCFFLSLLQTGYIRSSTANYYIEPAENFTSGSLGTILHRIKKLPHSAEESNDILTFEGSLDGGQFRTENGKICDSI